MPISFALVKRMLRRSVLGEQSFTPVSIEYFDILFKIPDHLLEQYTPLVTLIAGQILDYLSNRPINRKTKILLAIDEYASFRALDLTQPLQKLRKRNCRISNEVFLQRLSEINPYVIPLESYTRQDQHIRCRCSRCGYEWSVTPGALLRGNGCPSCSHTATSFFEQFLLLSFREVLGEDRVVSRDRKTIGSELDVFVPDMNLAFEYGAWFYHKRRLVNEVYPVL